jgi:hypothetical protein
MLSIDFDVFDLIGQARSRGPGAGIFGEPLASESAPRCIEQIAGAVAVAAFKCFDELLDRRRGAPRNRPAIIPAGHEAESGDDQQRRPQLA